MHSRARLLLEKELFKMKKEPIWGITAHPLNDEEWFTWEATVNGPKNSLWEGGIFKLYLQFNEEYNCRPPKVYFHTVPYHPNVDPITGVPCIDFLMNQDDWRDYYSITYILLGIQTMLSNPVIKDAVNIDAAQLCKSRKAAYQQMVLSTVLASKRVDAGLSPHLEEQQVDASTFHQPNKQEAKADKKRPIRIAQVSFEEYHSLWSGIATTRPVHNAKNPLNDILRSDSKLQAAHFGMQQQELQEEIQKQIAEHNSLMYGNFGKKENKKQDLEELRATRINMLKQIYLPKQESSSITDVTPSISESISKDIEPSEHEVEELLNWSSNLDKDEIYT